MQLKDVMTCGVTVVLPEATVQEAAREMEALEVGPLPVCEGERLVGMLTDRDITVRTVAAGRDPATILVREVMTPEVVYGFADQGVQEAVKLMEAQQIRRLPVLNRDRELVGIVALGDLALEPGTLPQAEEALKGVSAPAAPRRRAGTPRKTLIKIRGGRRNGNV
jgi:CBS domain-containing protein